MSCEGRTGLKSLFDIVFFDHSRFFTVNSPIHSLTGLIDTCTINYGGPGFNQRPSFSSNDLCTIWAPAGPNPYRLKYTYFKGCKQQSRPSWYSQYLQTELASCFLWLPSSSSSTISILAAAVASFCGSRTGI